MTGDPQRGGSRLGAVPRLSRFALEYLLLLPIGAGVALLWVNADAESYFRFSFASAFAVNSVAMAFFFGLMTKEVVEATAPGGVLHPWRRGLLPVIAAVGATVVPALLYIGMVDLLDEPVLSIGWPVAFATDIAVSYFVARLIFRKDAMVSFLLLLAIASDVFAFLTMGMTQPPYDRHLTLGLAIMAVAIAIAFWLRKMRVRSFWPYLLAAGSVSWYALYRGGFEPALALVPIVPFLPHAARDPGFFVDAKPDARDALSQFEVWWRYPAQLALLFFGLVNAGVAISALEEGQFGMPVAVLVGKPVGVLLASGAAIAAGLHLPAGVGWRQLIVGGVTAAVGFSIGLFLAAAIVPPGQTRAETQMGVLLSLIAIPIAFAAARVLRVGRFAR